MSEFVRGLRDKETQDHQYKGNAFLRLMGYLKPYIKTVLICFLLVSILTALEIYRPMLIGDAIERQIQQQYNYNLGAALSLVLMVMILISMAIMNKFADPDGGMVV